MLYAAAASSSSKPKLSSCLAVGAQPGSSKTWGLRDPGDQSRAETFSSSPSRDYKCISQRHRHTDTRETLTRLATLATRDKALP